MVKVRVGDKVYQYDTAADVHYDYPDAVYINGYFIAEEKGDEEQ